MDTLFDNDVQTRSATRRRMAVGVVLALLLTSAVLGGYLYLRSRHAKAELEKQLAANPPAKPVPSPLVQVTQDEPKLKGSNAAISGVVKNISNSKLSGLTLELELTRRSDGGTERKSVAPKPVDLAPGEEGAYNLTIPREFRSLKVAAVRSSNSPGELAFHTVSGARRPLEGPPATKIIIENRNTSRGKGEEFINTPDNPSKVP
jgi:hypothetical protein